MVSVRDNHYQASGVQVCLSRATKAFCRRTRVPLLVIRHDNGDRFKNNTDIKTGRFLPGQVKLAHEMASNTSLWVRGCAWQGFRRGTGRHPHPQSAYIQHTMISLLSDDFSLEPDLDPTPHPTQQVTVFMRFSLTHPLLGLCRANGERNIFTAAHLLAAFFRRRNRQELQRLVYIKRSQNSLGT